MVSTSHVFQFIVQEMTSSIPPEAIHAAKRSLLDLLGVAAAGRMTTASNIAHDVAGVLWSAGPRSATLVFDGRTVSPAGAAFAGAQTIDSFDAHDGFKPAKGHAGVAILPALLAVAEAEGDCCEAQEFLEALIVGYEVACRVAIVQHRSCPDYHASGSWNALGAAAVGCRLQHLDVDATRHALGIAEYYGPRAQMMRVIEHPTMLKDSSSWGAMAGVSSSYLAAAGFTGAPAITVEADDAADVWADLGGRRLIIEQYFKPWPVCRWAQPAVQAALELAERHHFKASEIRGVTIETFREARLLAGHAPTNTEQAQYSIAYPTACALIRRRIGAEEVTDRGLSDAEVQAVANLVEIAEREQFNSAFPSRRFAQVRVRLNHGKELVSRIHEPPGDPESPLPDHVLAEKFLALAEPYLGAAAATELATAIGPLGEPTFDLSATLRIIRQRRSAAWSPSGNQPAIARSDQIAR